MGSPRNELDLLLKAPNLIESEMAQELLSEAGIPSLLHPVDSREAFVLSHHPFDAPDLYVPKGMRDRAEQILRAAWSKEAIERSFPELASEGEFCMSSPRTEFDRLLEAPDAFEAEMACELASSVRARRRG